ncbi:MAG: Aldehyde reductase [Candidatus Beckwithbacteria bacterium GW2011_GWA2_43_10]|uniref:Aldehyde reductase n=1 Tax=Candidatus Beckwithbacteria bacterium GW2011_GWA2_43_10 TaxID=1618369 RepID=A0A0G1C197_9BACT|nr:MAG: Aldehyde reductase [Candidatus Beckwithbacteria bacterium GW2011_GWA2_43_10]
MKSEIVLNNGYKIPIVGLGTWRSDKKTVGLAVKYALTKAGYKHIDCASIYRNEKQIGKVLAELFSSTHIKRKSLFITSKLWNTDHSRKRVEIACRKTLKDLQLEYLDLYLMHWGIAFKPGRSLEPVSKNGMVVTEPVAIQETWAAMEKLVKKGLVKSIGVANFTTIMLVDLLTYAKIKPAMNQVEINPYNSQRELVDFCKHHKIALTAYSPLGNSSLVKSGVQKLLNDKAIKAIAKNHHKTPAQVVLNWNINRGVVVIPKSTHLRRIEENIKVFDFQLLGGEIEKINRLNKNNRLVNPVGWWGIPYFN